MEIGQLRESPVEKCKDLSNCSFWYNRVGEVCIFVGVYLI